MATGDLSVTDSDVFYHGAAPTMPAKGHSPSSNVDTYAPCPFTVSDILPLIHSQVTGKKRKRNVTQGEKGLVQTRPQEWPFGPSGDSRTQRMDVSYRIEPLKGWLDMTRYKSFFRQFPRM